MQEVGLTFMFTVHITCVEHSRLLAIWARQGENLQSALAASKNQLPHNTATTLIVDCHLTYIKTTMKITAIAAISVITGASARKDWSGAPTVSNAPTDDWADWKGSKSSKATSTKSGKSSKKGEWWSGAPTVSSAPTDEWSDWKGKSGKSDEDGKGGKSGKSSSKDGWWSAAPTVSSAPSSEKEWSDWKGSGKSSKASGDDWKGTSSKSSKWSGGDGWKPSCGPEDFTGVFKYMALDGYTGGKVYEFMTGAVNSTHYLWNLWGTGLYGTDGVPPPLYPDDVAWVYLTEDDFKLVDGVCTFVSSTFANCPLECPYTCESEDTVVVPTDPEFDPEEFREDCTPDNTTAIEGYCTMNATIASLGLGCPYPYRIQGSQVDANSWVLGFPEFPTAVRNAFRVTC